VGGRLTNISIWSQSFVITCVSVHGSYGDVIVFLMDMSERIHHVLFFQTLYTFCFVVTDHMCGYIYNRVEPTYDHAKDE